MRKIFKFTYCLFLLVIGIFFVVSEINAHPLDITATELYVNSGSNKIEAHTYVHPFLIGVLLKNNNISYDSTSDYYKHKELIVEYFNKNFDFKNNNQACRISAVNFPPMDEYEIIGGGLEIIFDIECSENISKLDYTNKLFIEYSKLQTNKMVFLQNGELLTFVKDGDEVVEQVLTAKVTNGFFDFLDNENNNIETVDTDNDGLGDNEESLYGTDILIPDSDFDGYTDKEEVDNGWDPKDYKASPGQAQKIKIEEAKINFEKHYENDISIAIEMNEEENEIKELRDSIEENISQPLINELGSTTVKEMIEDKNDIEEDELTDQIIITSEEVNDKKVMDSSKYFKTGRLQKYLEKIKELFNKGDYLSLAMIFGLIFLLGVLHAFESGHGKSILASHLVEHDKGYKDAFIFSFVMTITHLIDVIILSIVFKIFSVTTDIYHYINNIQQIGASILLLMGIYYLIKVFIPKSPYEKKSSYKKAAWLAVIAGLAPCTIGWAIMVIMLSIGKINLVIPVIISFGFGIWTTLFMFGLIIVKLRSKFVSRIKNLTKVTSVLSAMILIIIAVLLLIK